VLNICHHVPPQCGVKVGRRSSVGHCATPSSRSIGRTSQDCLTEGSATATDRPSMARGPVHRAFRTDRLPGCPAPARQAFSTPARRAARESGRRCGIDRHHRPARCGMMGRSRR
jgi:hypothetical protein